VKRIVSAHGGFVSVRSRVGVGSQFHIILPAVI
jgi:signal transduction histidine kinase